VENIVTSVMNAKYSKTLKEFTAPDKEKLLNMFKNMFSTNVPKENVDIIVKFFTDNFTEDETKVYVDHALTQYKPGMVYNGIRISNHTIQYILEGFNTYPLMKGIIINKKYINDLLPFFGKEVDDAEEFEYNKDTLMVEKDYTNQMLEVFNDLVVDTDVRFHNDDDIFVLATFDNDIAKKIKDSFDGLEVQSIPVHMFEWSKTLQVILPEKEVADDELEELIPPKEDKE